MRLSCALGLGLLLATLPRLAAAGEPAPAQSAPEKAKPERVHLGSTSVTVVDEHEQVDDVITRLRAAQRQEPDRKPDGPAKGDGKSDGSKSDGRSPAKSDTKSKSGQHANNDRSALRGQRDSVVDRANAERDKDQKRERLGSAHGRSDAKQRH